MGEKTRINSAGFLEGYDEETGKILWTQKRDAQDPTAPVRRGRPRGRPTKKDTSTHHHVLDASGRKVWVPKGTNPDNFPRLEWPYSQVTAMHICQKVSEGETLTDIGRMEGFPPKNVIDHWSRKYSEFKDELKQARLQRAEHYHDRVFEIAKATRSDTNKEDRLKIEAYKWGAQVGDPEQFGNRTKVTGDGDNPLRFVIDTGIHSEPAEVPQISEDSGETE
jgi:hypothetical protein